MSLEKGASSDSILRSSDVDQIIKHQEKCTAKLQEQISVLIVKQEHLHHHILTRHHEPESHSPYHQLITGDFPAAASRPSKLSSLGQAQKAKESIRASDMNLSTEYSVGSPASPKPMNRAIIPVPVTTKMPSADLDKPTKEKSAGLDHTTKSAPLKPRVSQTQVADKMQNIHMAHLKRFTKSRTSQSWTGNFTKQKYNDLTVFQKMVRSSRFDQVCAVMLITNSAFIGLQVEYAAKQLTETSPIAFKMVDYCYGVWFIAELLVRFLAAGFSFFTDSDERVWNIFDSLIVGMSTFEMVLEFFKSSGPLKNLSIVRTVRIARIARIARMIRLLRFFRSLRILLGAILSTLKSCIWTAMLLGMLLYMFGIVFVQAVTEYRLEADPDAVPFDMIFYFGTLPRGIFTMFKCVLGGVDWQVAVLPLSDVHEIYVAVFVIMITFIYLAVTNVISGLFLQSAIESAQSDREDIIRQRLQDKEVYVEKALSLFHEIDDNYDGEISLTEFESHLNDSRIIGFLNALEIDLTDAWTLFALLDVDQGGSVSLEEFIEGCLRIRGTAKSLHIAQVLYENKWLMDAMHELSTYIDCQFGVLQDQLEHLKGHRPPVSNPKPCVPTPSNTEITPPSSMPTSCTAHPPKSVPSSEIAAPPLPAGDCNSKIQPDDHTAVTEMLNAPSNFPHSDEVESLEGLH